MKELLAKSMRDFKEGSIVKGTILEIRPREVLVDIGYKSEGAIPGSEFDDLENLQVGDEVEVLLCRLENDEGMVVLSKERAAAKQNWEKIVGVFNAGGLIKGKVKGSVKGGLLVNIGVEAFCPGSQIDIVPPKDLTGFVGNTYEFKIVKLMEDRRNVVLSRREIIEAERSEKRGAFMATKKKGDTVKGIVKNLTDFGAFVDLDGMDGLLHITDMTWGRLNHPSELLKVGQEIDVVILDINMDKERISLGLKQTQRNPWDKIEERFAVGSKVKGKVTNLMPYGAFVELEEGVEGLIHVTHRDGDLVELDRLTAGDIFGEVSLFDHQPRSADVQAVTDCILLKINEGVLRALAAFFPAAAFKFLLGIAQEMAQRLRRTNTRYVDSVLAPHEPK